MSAREPAPRRQDAPAQSAASALTRLGLDPAAAVPALRTLGLWSEEGEGGGALPAAQPALEAIAASANPDRAIGVLARLAEQRPADWQRLVDSAEESEASAPGLLRRTAVVAGASEALGDLLVSNAGAVDALDDGLEALDAGTVAAQAAAALADPAAATPRGGASPAGALAVVQRHGLLRVAARDLLGLADLPAVTSELSELAEGVLAAALDHVAEDAPAEASLAVIGMGKLGGRELNYVSDVDVLFVHTGDRQAATRWAERFLRLLGEVTPAGKAYEIDVNLRPEGRDGQLVRSLDAYVTYYERWSRTWEYQALLKARPVAGDRALGAALIDAVERFVWPDRLNGEAVAEIQAMKGVVESSRQVKRDGSRQVKLAPGGLRDIEFAVQLLQLVHGRHDPALRSPNTLVALEALADGGYVGEEDAQLFAEAYRFLRTIEHRLQLTKLRRTHTLPRDAGERHRLARSLGFRDHAERTALDEFDREYQRVQGAVRHLHEKLFYRPLLERFAEVGAEDRLVMPGADERPQLQEHAASERLAALGFRDPGAALGHLDALASGVTRRARLFRTLLPALLPTLAAQPDPDGGLAAFRALADRLGESPFFLRTLRDTPPVGELLAQVLGRSRVVGEWLQRQPEVFGELADRSGLAERREPEQYRRSAEGLLRRGEASEGVADALRRLRRREVLRTAVRDLGEQASVADVGVELTGVAEACLEAAVGHVVPEGLRFAVIAMGKLGGRELSYASDLDVLFVFEPAAARDEALEAATSLVRTLGEVTPEGQAFRVDTNLRPEGKDGPLARSLDSYRSYYERWGETWELQALTQARVVAGDAALGAAFCEAVGEFVYPLAVPAARLQQVRRMKARVERERAGQRRTAQQRPRAPARAGRGPQHPSSTTGVQLGDRVDLKLGAGGASDVEWTVQLLQLAHGGAEASLRQPGTLAGLTALERAGLLGEEDAAWLREGYELVWRLRSLLYLAGFRDTDRLPPGAGDQERLSRMLGYPAGQTQQFVEQLGRSLRRVRKVHERCFYDQAVS